MKQVFSLIDTADASISTDFVEPSLNVVIASRLEDMATGESKQPGRTKTVKSSSLVRL